MQEISDWLEKLGLGQYAQCFADNDISFSVLPDLTDQHLKEIGVSLGHRLQLLRAIAELTNRERAIPKPTIVASPVPQDTAERRQVTVMFSDLVGSTALSTRMDPEDLREVISTYQKCVAQVVQRFDGFIAKYMGDGVLVYFGYPQAHEDDAERAVRAGLELITAVGALKTRAPLQTRIGIATGMVIVGDLIGSGSAQEQAVVGETPNLAARLEGLAAPGDLVVAETTRRQLGHLFDLHALGPHPLAGFTEPQRAWLVLGEGGTVSRFEALRSTATQLVGRDEELDLLRRRWEQAKTSEGRVVLISGEPGIGKSRLAAAVYEATEDEPRTRLRWFCSPLHQGSALHPTIVQLEGAAGFARDDDGEAKRAKLRELLGRADADGFELVAELLSLPNAVADLNLSPQRKRARLFEALLNEMGALSRQRPVLAMFEDVHWIDPTSREMLDLMVDRVRHMPVLLIVTFRPEFQQSWVGQPHVTILALNRLDGRHVASLVLGLAGNTPLGSEVVQEIAERTDGVPLFVEELTKAVLERADQEHRVDTAERRQVTVMFSDLVGSTVLSARMDPEDLREVIAAYQKSVAETAQRFGGYIAKYMGDGVLVYFGYPQAREDDAERAVRTGLELLAAVGALKTHAPLQTRVGIATGVVVVGDLVGSGASREQGICVCQIRQDGKSNFVLNELLSVLP